MATFFSKAWTRPVDFFDWERLRRFSREPVFDKTGLALLTLLGTLLLLRLRDENGAALAELDPRLLMRAIGFFLLFFVTWLPAVVVISTMAPPELIDYQNKESFVDASLKCHSMSAKDNFRLKYVDAWDDLKRERPRLRMTALALVTLALTFYAISLALVGLCLLPFVPLPH